MVVLGSVFRGDRLAFVAQRWTDADVVVLLSEPHSCPAYIIQRKSHAQVSCFVSTPETTRGEAHFVVDFARSHGIHQITVVTTADQLTRARWRFKRCWPGPLAVVAAPDPQLDVLLHVPYQVLASAKALLLERDC
ncbi:MAG: hypothetical protein M3O32_00115 [Actinomycetota bacterium]|nr:hypothetical protein [Actinomycetota bacterium]